MQEKLIENTIERMKLMQPLRRANYNVEIWDKNNTNILVDTDIVKNITWSMNNKIGNLYLVVLPTSSFKMKEIYKGKKFNVRVIILQQSGEIAQSYVFKTKKFNIDSYMGIENTEQLEFSLQAEIIKMNIIK